MQSSRPDVVVVGAGLAGLNAARLLHDAGLDVLVLEREHDVGGRVRTDSVDGFTLDHGFQLLNPAYPAARRTWDYPALNLRPLRAGIRVARDGSSPVAFLDPRQEIGALPGTTRAALDGSVAPPWRLGAFGAYAALCGYLPPQRLRERPDVAFGEALRRFGVGHEAVDRLVRPFLSGVFGEDPLRVSRRYADLVLRSFVRGTPSVPAAGMQALPRALAATLPPEAVRCGTAVSAVRPGSVSTNQGEIHARAVIVAASGTALAGLSAPPMNALTTWYFATDAAHVAGDRGLLTVDGRRPRGPLANVAVMSGSVPEYAPPGRALIAATAVGFWPLERAAEKVRSATAELLDADPGDLAEIARYPIEQALPQAHPPFPLRRDVSLGEGMFLIGDHRDTPSIQGALVSGERGADAVQDYLVRGKQTG